MKCPPSISLEAGITGTVLKKPALLWESAVLNLPFYHGRHPWDTGNPGLTNGK